MFSEMVIGEIDYARYFESGSASIRENDFDTTNDENGEVIIVMKRGINKIILHS